MLEISGVEPVLHRLQGKQENEKLLSIATISFAMLLTGCAAPVSHTNVPMSTYDKDTEYSIVDRENGFGITVFYNRYQFVPESDAVATACKQQLTSIAWEHADLVGKEINPINEQRIKISMGRNGFSGITSCQATTVATFK